MLMFAIGIAIGIVIGVAIGVITLTEPPGIGVPPPGPFD
jgi:hypothetical protein